MKAASTSIVLTLGLMVLAPNVSRAQQGTVVVQPAPPQYGQPGQAQPAQPVQPQYAQPQYAPQPEPRTEERPRLGLIIGGSVTLGVSWLIHGGLISPFAGWSFDRGYQSDWEPIRYLGLVPVLGPWLQLGLKPTGFSNDGWGPYLIANGILQAGGLTLIILGATVQETVTLYGDSQGSGSFMAVAPSAGGLQLYGAF